MKIEMDTNTAYAVAVIGATIMMIGYFWVIFKLAS